MLLAWPIEYSDLNDIDRELARALHEVRALDADELEDLCLDFTVSVEEFGVARTVELKPRGGEIEVCAENVDEYLELRLRYMMVERVSDQLAQFVLGVYDVVPLALLCVFTTHELELLICGLPFIDVTDWRSHTVYRGASDCPARRACFFAPPDARRRSSVVAPLPSLLAAALRAPALSLTPSALHFALSLRTV